MDRKRSEVTSEYSSGGVVFRLNGKGKGWEIVAVQRARHEDWSLPKGHIEADETREQAALREVKEETGLDASILYSLGEIQYYFRKPKGDLIRKIVYYYLMEATTEKFGKPNWEVSEARWVNINEARNLLSYEKDKEVVTKALVELRVRFPENDDRRVTSDE
jgi:8-oxo-dGTP diphosphatase